MFYNNNMNRSYSILLNRLSVRNYHVTRPSLRPADEEPRPINMVSTNSQTFVQKPLQVDFRDEPTARENAVCEEAGWEEVEFWTVYDILRDHS